MKIKLDENLDARLVELFERAGHDCATVCSQGLGGGSDERIFRACVAEKRVIVSHDLDFSNVIRFPPGRAFGVVVLRGPNQLLSTTRRMVRSLLILLSRESPKGELWIVEERRVRIYRPED